MNIPTKSNNLTKVDEIPNELLQKIFSYVLETSWHYTYILRAVNKKWKSNAEKVLLNANFMKIKGHIENHCFNRYMGQEKLLTRSLELSPNIKKLHIENIRITINELTIIILNKSIKDLRIIRVKIMMGDVNNWELSCQNYKIKTLEIFDTFIREDIMWTLFAYLPNLKNLILKRPNDILKNFHNSDFSHNYIYLKSLNNLTIDLDDYNKSDRVMHEIEKNLGESLTYLSLSTGRYINIIINYLRHFTKLETLRIRYRQETWSPWSWPYIKTLKKLHISDWTFNFNYIISDSLFWYICTNFTQLEEFKIEVNSWNKLKGISLFTLHAYNSLVRYGTSIEILHLKGFEINNQCVKKISMMKSLKLFILEEMCGFNDGAIQKLLDNQIDVHIISNNEYKYIDTTNFDHGTKIEKIKIVKMIKFSK